MSDPLLDAAIDQFGEHGLAGASTRAIAAAAGTAMSTITYRYGGKSGLYLAAADHIAQVIAERLRPTLNAPVAGPVERVVGLVQRFAALMLADESRAWARFIVREQMQPTEAFARLWDGAMGEVLDVLVSGVAEATEEADPRAARLTAITLMGQAVIFRAARASVLRALGRTELDAGDIAAIQARLAGNIHAILGVGGER